MLEARSRIFTVRLEGHEHAVPNVVKDFAAVRFLARGDIDEAAIRAGLGISG